MKKTLTIVSLSVLLFALTTDSFPQTGRRQWAAQRNYNPATVVTVEGRVDKVLYSQAVKGRSDRGIHLAISVGSEKMEVHLGPASFVEGKMTFAGGDAVKVEGSKLTSPGKSVIIAKRVSKGTSTLTLRNDDGTPLWAGFYGRRRAR